MSIFLYKTFPFNPTPDQIQVLDLLDKFVSSTNALELFLLRGYAGTGKTTIIAHVAKELNKDHKIVLMAPTGRAARVLSTYCGLPAYTIHKKIYRMVESVNGDYNFVLQKNNFRDTLFIVDEASMISMGNRSGGDVLEDLMRFVYRGKGCKLILTGDSAQLPPIDSEYSPGLDSQYLIDSFRLPVTEFELSTVLRQDKVSGVLFNATRLRDSIHNGTGNIQFNLGFDDFKSINGIELQEYLEECISEFGHEEVLIITRSNKRANQFNSEVRHRILYREDSIETGDMLMCVKNNYHWLKEEEIKGDFIANGESMEVLKVLSVHELYGFKFADVRVRFVDNRIPDIDIKVCMDSLTTEGASLPISDIRNLFHKVMEDYVGQGEIKKAKQLALIDPYVNAVQVKFSYAVTCHKSQGGQWPVVFIDHGYLVDDMVDEGLLRWFYTAITRATKKVFLVNCNKNFLEE